jgi:putative FmdB family regulatory protein
MPTYDWNCDECGHCWEFFVHYDKRDENYTCPECGGVNTTRQFPAPMIMTAALPDGVKRKGWDRMKEAAKLTREKAVTKSDSSRKEIANEIRKLGVRIEKT